MADIKQSILQTPRRRKVHYRGRMSQVSFIFGKLLRMFVYQNDWKVLPMAALIAALVSMVVKYDFFLTMEGTLKGALALTCVGIWNGCFNSIQVICRERGIIKREHRSGMHISSYIVSHMLYQALLCLAQTILTIYVCSTMGVQFPQAGFITSFFILDIGITIFLISYASSMLALWISCLAHSTTTAMTVMPFLLIFQLVFSGGIFYLPAWCQTLADFTVSKYGIICVAAQADYNSLPMVTGWNTIQYARNNTVAGTVTLGQVLDFMSNDNNEIVQQLRTMPVGDATTVGHAWETLQRTESWKALLAENVDINTALDLPAEMNTSQNQNKAAFTVGEAFELFKVDKLVDLLKDKQFGRKLTLGEAVDFLAVNPDVQKMRDESTTVQFTVGQLISSIGEERVKAMITDAVAASSKIPAYEHSVDNILDCWLTLGGFIFAYAALAMLSLKPIDRDRR